jgi:hypothetical protein
MFSATEGNNTIKILIEYSTALFKKETIEKISKHFKEILEQVVKNKDIKLKEVTITHDFLTVGSNAFQEDVDDWL